MHPNDAPGGPTDSSAVLRPPCPSKLTKGAPQSTLTSQTSEEDAMNVMHIMKLKGSSVVETVSPESTVAAAADILAAKRFGALVVSVDGSDIAGILSERDIVRALAREAGGCLTMPISKLMTESVETCSPAETANSVLQRMTSGRFRHMPVTEDGKMLGLLSIGDVVKARMAEIEQENAAMVELLSG
jgi:CBS domain-containing protein